MSEMTRIERVRAVLEGHQPDRPPVSFWYHFPPGALCGPGAVDAHLRHLSRYDLDFLKIMNDNPYPTRRVVRCAADLRDLPVLKGDEEGLGAQLDLIRSLVGELSGNTMAVSTIFNPWSVLRTLVHPPKDNRHAPPKLRVPAGPADVRLSELLAEDQRAVAEALDTISVSLANFARRSIEAGADGIFLSVCDDRVDTLANGMDTYDRLVRPGDKRILKAATAGRCNILHVCGVSRKFDAFAEYPVDVINWADRAAGPAIRDVVDRIKPVVCGGVDNLATLPHGKPADIGGEVADALRQAADRPMIVAPGCTFDPDRVPEENLDAMVRAAREM